MHFPTARESGTIYPNKVYCNILSRILINFSTPRDSGMIHPNKVYCNTLSRNFNAFSKDPCDV